MVESTSNSTRNGLKLLGESILPGASLIMEGRIVAGGAHTIVSTLARLALGPFGVALVAANAYSTSVTGKGLLAQLTPIRPKKQATTTEATTTAAAGAAAQAAAPAAAQAVADGPPMEPVPPPPLRNLALGRPASQSSTAFGGDAARAVDGKTDGNWPAGGVTHTACDAQAWWLVDLGAVYPIDQVVLHNRTDSCGERLTNFFVRVSKDERDWHSVHHPGTAPARVAFPVGRAARYVKVQLADTCWLSLAEVEVLGTDVRE